MERWKINLKSQELAKIYDEYLHSQERALIFYLGSVVLSKHASFPEKHKNTTIKASGNFEDSATSIRSIGHIRAMLEDGSYDQLARSFIVINMVTTLSDFFEGVMELLQLDIQMAKKTKTIKEGAKKDVVIKSAPLKIAHLANSTLNLDSRICDHYSSGWINCIINLRHMFVHEQGLLSSDAKAHMVNVWDNLEVGDPITFDENQIDSILWFFNDHVRDFTTRLDEKLPLPPV